MAECGDQEVMVGVRMVPRDPANDTAGISLAAICQDANGVTRTVTNFAGGSKQYTEKTRVVMQGEQQCPKGRYYGAGVGMADYGDLGFGPTLRCGAANPIPADQSNMTYVLRQFNAPPPNAPPPPSIVFATNPGSAGAAQRYDEAVSVAHANGG